MSTPPPQRFSASNAARHMACHASANLPLAIPGWTPPVVDPAAGAKGRGTAMHEYLELTAAFAPADLRGLAKAIEYMAELRSQRRFKMLTEHTFTATWLATKPVTTVDVVLYLTDELHILDYKTGRILVEAANNPQLLFYAACAAELAPKAKGVWLHIVQPWADNLDKVFVTTQELRAFMDEARDAEAAIQSGDTTFGPSDNCKFCPANPHSRGDKGRPMCPAMMRLLYPPAMDELAMLND